MRPSILRRAVDRSLDVAHALLVLAALMLCGLVLSALSKQWIDRHL